MLKSLEGNFDNPEVHELLVKHFIELKAASPEGSAHVLDIPGLKVPSIKFWSLWEDKKLIGCVIRGDYEINETKLRNYLNATYFLENDCSYVFNKCFYSSTGSFII